MAWGATALDVDSRYTEPQDLTFSDRFGEDYKAAEVVPLGDGQYGMHAPRNMVARPTGSLDQTVAPHAHFENHFKPYNRAQEILVPQSLAYLQARRDHVLQSGTGTGKTYMGTTLAAHLQTRTLIIVTKEDLKKQWLKAIKDVMGLEEEQVGLLQGDAKFDPEAPIVIGMLQSIYKGHAKYPPELFDHFGFVIFDEVQFIGAEQFSKAASLFNCRHRLGLSATPKRSDGREELITAHLGPVLLKYDEVPMVPKVIFRKTGWRPPYDPSPARTMGVFKLMLKNDERNDMVAKNLYYCWVQKRKTVAFCHLREAFVDAIYPRLVELGVPPEDIGQYFGGMSEEELEEAASKPMILTTYKMMDYGTSIDSIDMALFVTPKSNVKQAAGRALREVPGKWQPVIIDMVDEDSLDIVQNKPVYGKAFKGMYYGRLHFYKELGAEVMTI